ncbi:MAG TPA: hypothetical protein VJ552_05330 [Sediminibacterium sp.]|nr:hypothetical protein [Sediminibacterium sp.]
MLTTEFILNFIVMAWLLATIAFVYSCILTEPGMLLGNVYGWITEKAPWYLHKPLISCERCVVGQWSFWLYFYLSGWNLHPNLSQVIGLLFFISQSIISVAIIKAVYYRITETTPPNRNIKRKIKTPAELCNN